MISGDEGICALCYLMIIGVVYVPAFLVGCVAAVFWYPHTWKGYGRRVLKVLTFLILLLLVGDFFSIAWGDTIWGRFYYSTDYCGTDFWPFCPVLGAGQMLNSPWGNNPHGLVPGVSLAELNSIWLLFAIATWSMTFGIYGYLVHKFNIPKG